MIAYIYGVNHPGHKSFYNTESILTILTKAGIGSPSRLRSEERNLRPDITDTLLLILFEIKPWNEQGLQEGREEAQRYLTVLNRTILSGKLFTGGSDFHGEVLIRFARGEYIWRLEWRTAEPGVILYRWTRSQQRFESEAAAYDAGQWTELNEQDLRQYGGWVSQAVESMVHRREELTQLSEAVGTAIDFVGTAATVFFWSELLGRMGAGTEGQQPPTQGGGQVIPFPARPPPVALPAQSPAAVGTSFH